MASDPRVDGPPVFADAPVRYPFVESAQDLQKIIRDQITHHKKMIQTLQWFSSHIGLDSPEGLAVGQIIVAGLRALAEDDRKSPATPDYQISKATLGL